MKKYYVTYEGLSIQCDEIEKDTALNMIWLWKNKEVVASCRLDEFAVVYRFDSIDMSYVDIHRV